MKKILFIIILSMICANSAGAAEIFGRISTNPDELLGNSNNPPAVDELKVEPAKIAEELGVKTQIGGAVIILPKQNTNAIPVKENQAKVNEIKVLGVSFYPEGTLLRGSDHKIYVTQGKVKKYIANLTELGNYHGQVIITATAEELSQYEIRGHLNGELIREKGTVKVYVIEQGKKRHILNLEELRAYFAGLEIFNISREEMAQY